MRTAWLESPQLRMRMWAMLAAALLLLMECMVMSLWYQALFQSEGVSLVRVFAILLSVLVISHLIPQVMEARRVRMLYRQLIFVLWILLAAFASLKLLIYPHTAIGLGELLWLPVRFILRSDAGEASFFHLIAIILITWRGVSLARGVITLGGVQSSFQIGLVFLLLYGMIFALLYPQEATLGLYTYLLCGLISMSAARVANLSGMRGGRIPRFGLGWMGSILAAGLAVVALAVFAGWVASGQIRQVIAAILLVFFGLLTVITLIILSPLLSYLADLLPKIADLIQQLLARLRSIGASQQIEKLIQAMNEGLGKIIPYVLATRGLVLIGIVFGLVLFILLALVLRKRREEKDEEEEGSPTAASENENPLSSLLRRLMEGARRLRLRSPAQLLAAARIRQIYRQLMELSKKMGAERSPSVTPLEFLPTLSGLMPEEGPGLSLITQAYLKIRYGEFPETVKEVQEVETAWEQVRQKGRRIVALNKKKK